MPQPFFYQANARPDSSDDDTDVFFDMVNSLPQQNRVDLHEWPCSAIAGTIDTQYGSDDNCFSDLMQLAQVNRVDDHIWPNGQSNAIVSDSVVFVDSDTFADLANALPQENRREYERFATSWIDGNLDFADTDVFSDTLTPGGPQENRHDYFVSPAQFQDGNADISLPVITDVFTDTFSCLPQENRRDDFARPWGESNAILSDGVELLDSDSFSDTYQLDSACRVDVFMWAATWIDGNADFGETDVFTDSYQLDSASRADVPLWQRGAFSATQSDSAGTVDSDVFSITYDPAQMNRVDEFTRDISSAGPNAFEDDASFDVYSSTHNPLPQENLKAYEGWYFTATCDVSTSVIDSHTFPTTFDIPQQNRRDEHIWPTQSIGDPSIDDPSQYVFADTFQLPQENVRPQHEFPAQSSGPNTSEDDAAYDVYFDSLNTRPVETLKPYEQWPTSAAGDSDIDDPSWYVFFDSWNALPIENRKEYERFQSVAGHDSSETYDSPLPSTFELPQENRHEQFAHPFSAQGDASETDPSAFIFSETFDVPQANRADSHAWPFAPQSDPSDDNTYNLPQFDTFQPPQENRHEYFVLPCSAMADATESDAGDEGFATLGFELPQERTRADHEWPFSSQQSVDDPDASMVVFFDTFQVPQTVTSVGVYNSPFTFLTQDIIVGIVTGAIIEAMCEFIAGPQAIDGFAEWCQAIDVFLPGPAALDGQ